MDTLSAVILGTVEGVTEFLPISSTGHLIVASDWLGLPQNEINTSFQIIIQLAAILAVVASYPDKLSPRNRALWAKLAIAFAPFGVVGYAFRHPIEELFAVEVVAVMFILGGVVFLVVERLYKQDAARVTEIEGVSYRQALWIGIVQVFALIPGTSRAGATIIGALLVGLDRRAAAEFSFLLALPVMLATSGYSFVKNYREFGEGNLVHLGVGFATAFVVAWLTMRLLIRFLRRYTFVGFGVYRILFGGLLLVLYAG